MAQTFLAALKEGNAMSLRLLLTLSGGLEILAELPALISPTIGAGFMLFDWL